MGQGDSARSSQGLEEFVELVFYRADGVAVASNQSVQGQVVELWNRPDRAAGALDAALDDGAEPRRIEPTKPTEAHRATR